MKKLLASLALGLGLLTGGAAALAQAPAATAAAPAAAASEAAPAAAAAAAPAAAAAAAPPLPRLPPPHPPPVPNKGDTAWMTVATVLVILMTIPGLALFYGGLVRSKNMLSVLMQVFVVTALIYVLWAMYGYSVAFTAGNPFMGSFDKLFLKGITPDSIAATFSKGVVIPELSFVAFQATFAAITCALIVGAFAERIKFSAVLLFVVLWFTFTYLPIAHMVWYWDGPDAITDAGFAGEGHGRCRLALGQGRAGLRGRHRGAHQRRCRRPGGRLRGGQAHRLRQGIADAAQPDPDHGRRLAAVGGLVRLQRRLQPGSQRRRRPGLRQHAGRHRRRHAVLDRR